MVKPVILYGADVWGIDEILKMRQNHSLDILKDKYVYENVHTTFCKQILRLPKRSSNIAVKLELGRRPIIINVIVSVIIFFNRLESMSDDRLVKQIYNVTKLSRYSITKAVNFVCNFLDIDKDNYNLHNERDRQCLPNEVKNSLIVLYDDEWYTSLNNDERKNCYGNKLRTYRKFKKVNELEPYLKFETKPILRTNLTKMLIL